MTMPVEALEETWERLAVAIDAAGPQAERFLAKLALLLAEEVGDAERIRALIGAALEDLE